MQTILHELFSGDGDFATYSLVAAGAFVVIIMMLVR